MNIRLTAFLALALAQAYFAVTFDTTTSWDGVTAAQTFGVTNSTTYGQTFVAPGGAMQSFTFLLARSVAATPAHLEMKGMIFAWNGTSATGPALFTSGTIVFDTTAAFQPVTVNTGSLVLSNGATYIALLTISDAANFAASSGLTKWGRIIGGAANDGGGSFQFHNTLTTSTNSLANLTTTPWRVGPSPGSPNTFGAGDDLAWRAVFTDIDVYQVRYFSNLAIGDSVINLSNSGASSDTAFTASGAQNGDICANVYAYSPDEQLVSCCSCNLTPNALNSLSVKNDLASNTLTPIIPSALVVKVIVSPGGAACTASSAATVTRQTLSTGLLAWGSTIHALPATAGTPATTYGLTETPFAQPSTLSDVEFTRMKQLCSFIRANGSGYGICKSCKVGGLGASSR